MTHPTKITDMRALLVGYLLWQFRDSENLTELIGIFADEVQSCENVWNDLVDDRMLDTAEGPQLDQYGLVVTWPRNGLSDSDYRKMIKVAMVMNQSPGNPDTATYVISQIVGVSVRYIQQARAHASFQFVRASALPQSDIDLLNSVMPKVVPAGVSWDLVEGVCSDPDFPVKQFNVTDAGFDQAVFARRIDVL